MNNRHGNNGGQPRNEAQILHEQSGLAYHVCAELLGAFRRKDTRRLAIIAEKHLPTASQNETLKEAGLTIFDCFATLEGTFGTYQADLSAAIFAEWNDRLGRELFLVAQYA
jgi:tripartite-type tricarboxylate transporter receptor subunit TctC